MGGGIDGMGHAPSWVNPNGNANLPYVNTDGNSNFNWADNDFNENWRWIVAVSYWHSFLSLHFRGEFCFWSWPSHPPSIFPISSSGSEKRI